MFAKILTTRRHLWVQFKGLKMDLDVHLSGQTLQCLFERAEADGTPGTSDIRDKINTHHRDPCS